MPKHAVLALLLMLSAPLHASAQTVSGPSALQPIRYTLRFPAPQTHYVEVEAVVPADGRRQVELMMPIWTPGSYLAREFARHVEDVAAKSPTGAPLGIRKSRKNRWLVDAGTHAAVTVTYRVYCREMSVRTNWVDAGLAILNGAPTFLTVAGNHARRHDVRLELPSTWRISTTSLDPISGQPHQYTAPDYDTLVDSPIVAGSQTVREFTVAGKRHLLVTEGDEGVWNIDRAVADVEKIVRAAERLWGTLPYNRYVFFNMLTANSGGLEHKDSTMLMTPRWQAATRRGYVAWLGLVGHEFFHAWNVKRLRPIELGPFDYENEVYTTSLWVAEGFTDYYGDLLVHRAGLSSREEYLSLLSDQIQALQTTPGRLVQAAEASSYDTWIKQYRPDENSVNTAISYYVKGAVIAFVLDARLRAATNGASSLDQGMRSLYRTYSGAKGYTGEELRKTLQEAGDVNLAPWFERVLETTAELEYDAALTWFGLRFAAASKPSTRGWLGLGTRAVNGRLVVSQVRRDTPGHSAGFNVDDEIIAIGELRVTADDWNARMEVYGPGQKAQMLIARRDRLMRLDVTFGAEPSQSWRLEVRPDATADQKARLAAWLAPPSSP